MISVIISITYSTQASTRESIDGYWVMPDGSALLEVYRLEESYSVQIVSLREQRFTAADNLTKDVAIGDLRRDIHNPDARLRQRSLLGLVIASGLKFEKGRWSGGSIYDPGSGRHYRCHLELTDGGLLRVRGYLGISLLGRTMYWQKAEDYKKRVTSMLQEV